MVFSPPLRKLVLTLHVATSVGWLGAVLAFLALACIGLSATGPLTVRGAYLVMEPAAWFVLVPLSLASFATGVVQSLGTPWGLFRHYWVIFKLVLNVFATIVLLEYMKTFRVMAAAAAAPAIELAQVRNPSPVVHSVLALLLLIVATVLAIYKPRGVTKLGRQ
jgi:hypothetical protein